MHPNSGILIVAYRVLAPQGRAPLKLGMAVSVGTLE